MTTHRATTAGAPSSDAPSIALAAAYTVYFDGGFTVCRREIAHYQRQRGAEAIAWIDVSRCDEVTLGPGLNGTTVMQRFHVRAADGTLVTGARAFVTIWRQLPGLAWLAKIASTRPALALLEGAYAIFLRVRPLWRPDAGTLGRFRADCANESASIPD